MTMGIAVTNAEKYRTCHVCASDKNVLNIKFVRVLKDVSYGTEIALCRDCVRELKLKLDLKIGME